MTSAVAWALLGLIIERPGYGGQLRQRLERSHGDLFALQSEGHVYRALDSLRDRGLIEQALSDNGVAVASGTDRLPMVPYVATAAGLQAFKEHVLAQLSEDRRQSTLLIRQFSVLANACPRFGLEALDSYSRLCAEQARRAGNRSSRPSGSGLGGTLGEELVQEDNRLVGESKIRWIDYARGLLKAKESQTPR